MLTLVLVNVLWLGLIEVVSSSCRPAVGRHTPAAASAPVGLISYGLYLYHFPLVMLALDVGHQCGYTGRPIYVRIVGVLLTVPVAALSWRFIERPLLELKGKYPYGVHAGDENRTAPPGPHIAGPRQSVARSPEARGDETAVLRQAGASS